MPYKDAFNCTRCPRSNDPQADRACPAWWEIMFENAQTGEQKIEKNCAFVLMPVYLLEVIKASNRAVEQTCQARDAVIERVDLHAAKEVILNLSHSGPSRAGFLSGTNRAVPRAPTDSREPLLPFQEYRDNSKQQCAAGERDNSAETDDGD